MSFVLVINKSVAFAWDDIFYLGVSCTVLVVNVDLFMGLLVLSGLLDECIYSFLEK